MVSEVGSPNACDDCTCEREAITLLDVWAR